jgi:hypothetical protein
MSPGAGRMIQNLAFNIQSFAAASDAASAKQK